MKFALYAAILATTLAAAPAAVARPYQGPAVGVWVDLHFSHANGQVTTITEPTNLPRAGAVAGYCSTALPADRDIAHGAFLSHPELAGMTFTGAECEKDKSGQIRVATGAWPAGQGPKLTPVEQHYVEAEDAYAAAHPVDRYANFSRNSPHPAVVALTFKLVTGEVVTYNIGTTRGRAAIDMSDCSTQLKQGLLDKLEYWIRRKRAFPGGTILSAACKPLAASVVAAR